MDTYGHLLESRLDEDLRKTRAEEGEILWPRCGPSVARKGSNRPDGVQVEPRFRRSTGV
jgi:hypothetical protein